MGTAPAGSGILCKQGENAVAIDKPSQCTMYSASLLRSLTAERTLAVQAALAKNPDVALVFLVHTLLLQFFGKQSSDILRVNVENKRTELLTNIGEKAETRKAIIALTECENEVIQRLPDEWKEDYSFLLEWSQEALINLLALCVSRGIDGVTDKIDNHGKASDKLSLLESALDFSLSDWWQPDSDNFFSRISKASISECLKNAGNGTEAKQALTLKKSDGAQLAAQTVNDTGWLPDCLMPLSTADIKKTSAF